MKARKVKGLDADGPLADQLQRIVEVRLDELCAFMPAAGDPAEVEHLHDMRIAAKRLRYILEISGELFGPYAAEATRRTKDLQDLVGEIHDCDVTLPQVRAMAQRAAREDAAAVRAAAPEDAEDLDPALAASAAPHADAHRGLATLGTYYAARRALLFDRFRVLWTELEREGFQARLRFAVTERAGQEPSFHTM